MELKYHHRRAIITFVTAVLIASATHLGFFMSMGSNGLQAALSWAAIRGMLLIGLLPSLAVSVWVAFSSNPTVWKAILVIAAAATIEAGATVLWLSSIEDALSQSYATISLLPVTGGVLCALISYAVGADRT